MSVTIQDFLSHLDSKRAFYAFVVALAASVPLIFAGLGAPLAPSIPVVLYGGLLFHCQSKYFLAFSSTVKDSPYFLGFILTLLALVQLLLGGIAAGADNALINNALVTRVAGAILPTVCGIFFRQLLMSWDPGETYFDKEYQTIAEGLRTDAAQFRDSQARFVQLVTEFVRTREELLSGEEKVFSEYVSGLKEGSTILSRIQRDYPKRIDGLLVKLDELAVGVAQAATKIQSTFVDMSGTFAQEFDGSRAALAAARTELESDVAALQGAFRGGLAGFAEHAEGLRNAASSEEESAALVRNATVQLSQRVGESGAEITRAVADIKRLTVEIGAIDGIVDDLLRLLTERIRALDAAG